ncbi:class I SAM-dependent methyltransferase [Paenibacillus yanchengensis]|uniref:Class I SAM-dependent methyltransferase n=1 Tax=Paenibacillus yanchengensis TaxID=2035833 RepID=A0ABW4YQY5_9BACL
MQQVAHYIAPQSKVAAYAEGEGRNAVYVAQQGHHVVAYDYAPSGLRKTAALADKKGVSVGTVQVDLVTDELPEAQYDAALMVFGHFAKQHQYHVLNKIVASIKPGGFLLLEVYEEAQINFETGGPRNIDWLYNAEQVMQWSKQHTTLKHFFVGEVDRTEGMLHTGKCSVIQIVLEK